MMSNPLRRISGEESISEIIELALEAFSDDYKHLPYTGIISRDGVPHLVLKVKLKNKLGEVVYFYRVDEVAQQLFAECERIHDEFAENLHSFTSRDKLVRLLAFNAISGMLRGLVYNQVGLPQETLNETLLITSGIVFKSLAAAYKETDAADEMEKACKAGLAKLLNETLKLSTKKKRKYLVGLLNAAPSLKFSVAGRPRGTKKRRAEKERERADFIKKIEKVYAALHSAEGKPPTKTRVAKELGIGGLNPSTGIDSSLTAFNNKLRRLMVDYKAVIEGIRLNK